MGDPNLALQDASGLFDTVSRRASAFPHIEGAAADRQNVYTVLAPSGSQAERPEAPGWNDPAVEAAIAVADALPEHDAAQLNTAIDHVERVATGPDSRRAGAWARHHRGRLRLATDTVGNAIVELNEALAQFTDLGDRLGAARTCALIGVALDRAGGDHSCLDHLSAAIETQETMGDRWGAANAYRALGTVLCRAGRFHEADLSFAEAGNFFGHLGQTLHATITEVDAAIATTRHGMSLAGSGDVDGGRALFSQTVRKLTVLTPTIEASRHPGILARITRGIGDALAGLDDHAAAVTHLLEAARLARSAGDGLFAAEADLQRARSLFASGLLEEVREVLGSIVEADSIPALLRVRAEAALLLSDVEELLGRDASAYAAFRVFHDLEVRRIDDDTRARILAAATGLDLNRLRVEAETAQLEIHRLEADAEDRSRFIAAVAHELRTPLTAVNGFANALVAQWDQWGDGEVEEMIQIIASEAGDASNIIEDLLAAAGVSRGTLQVIATVIDVADTVRNELRSIPSHVADETPPAHADSFRVRQVVRNLISNARRYGGANIECVIGSDENQVFIDLIDDGDGIPEHDAERIFEPFARSQHASPVATSMGLGLPISRELARLMGGDLTYRRSDDTTVFRLSLRRCSEQDS
jgi:signal transduction histidine kinase